MENACAVNNIVSLKMDRDAAESQSESSTPSNSLDSVLTVESSRGDADSNLDESEAWTNEKHSSYLDSLENSFVKQLYSFLGRDEKTRRMSRACHAQSNSHKPTHQFTGLQSGCRQKVNFGKKRAYTEMSSEYTTGTTNQRNVLCKESDSAFTRTSMRNSLGHEYPAQCTSEASGQNFREVVGEKGCNSGVFRKRRREANYDESSLNDQVVP